MEEKTVMRIPQDLARQVERAIRSAQEAGALPAFDIPPIKVTRSDRPEYGDYATPAAMQLAKPARMKPDHIAEAILAHFPPTEYVAAVDRVGGFMNFRLAEAWLQRQVDLILEQGESFAQMDDFAGKRAQVECVSANPTGPITVGRVRGGVMGDTLARLLRAMGYRVEMEYYFNNAGRQMRKLGESLKARYRERLGLDFEFPEDGYQGDYLYDIADRLIEEQGDALKDDDWEPFKEYAEAHIFETIRAALKRINIVFDNYFNENSLYESGAVQAVVDDLRERGLAYEQGGAMWFKTTELGMEQDKVLIKSSGEPTYRTPDIAYHIDKLERGFDPAINILGADHIEEYPDVLAGLRALGYDDSRVRVIIHQFVTLIEGGEEKRMSTRKGQFVTLDELVDDVGADAVRYFILARSPNSEMLFDLDLARKHSNENPVYYIQNAHVRCASIARKAGEEYGLTPEGGDVALLTDLRELALIRKLVELPEVVEQAVQELEPHKLAFWAHEELARLFHPTYEEIRALHSEVPEDLARARLKLYAAAQVVFKCVLDLMGMSAPEQM